MIALAGNLRRSAEAWIVAEFPVLRVQGRQLGLRRAEGVCAEAGGGEGWDFDENYRTCWSLLI